MGLLFAKQMQGAQQHRQTLLLMAQQLQHAVKLHSGTSEMLDVRICQSEICRHCLAETPLSTLLRHMAEAVCQTCLPYRIPNARLETCKVYQAGEVPQAAEQH